jgi:isopenicillin N synthase-like dioxygenase
MELKVDRNARGYSPFGLEYSDPKTQPKVGDTKEGFAIGHDIPLNHPLALSRPFTGPNQWPKQMEWRSTWAQYFDNMHALGLSLTGLVALSLDLPKTYFDPFFKDNYNQALCRFLRCLQNISFPFHFIRLFAHECIWFGVDAPQLSKPDEGVFGSGAHCDYGITLCLSSYCIGSS